MSYGGKGAPDCRLFVGGLAWATGDKALWEAFARIGEVTDAKVGQHSFPAPKQHPSRLVLNRPLLCR